MPHDTFVPPTLRWRSDDTGTATQAGRRSTRSAGGDAQGPHSHPIAFSSLLQRYRGRVGLTQQELAERAGLHPDTVHKLERGARQAPRCDTVQVLARALHLTSQEARVLEDAARSVVRPCAARPREPGEPPLGALLRTLADLYAREAALVARIDATLAADPHLRSMEALRPNARRCSLP